MQQGRLARTAAVVAGLGLLSSLFGFVREQVLAAVLGATGTTDAYVVALTLPDALTTIAVGGLIAALMPVQVELLSGGRPDEARAAASRLLRRLLLVGGGAALLLIPTLPFLLAPLTRGWPAERAELAVACARLILPGALASVAGAVFRVRLEAHRIFVITPLCALLYNLVTIGGIWLTSGGNPQRVATFVSVGAVVQLLGLAGAGAWLARRRGVAAGPSPAHAGGTRPMPLSLVLVWSGLLQAPMILERLLASHAGTGAVAALAYADRLRQFPVQTFMLAVTTVAYPAIAAAGARREDAQVTAVLRQALRLILLLALPISAGVLIFRGQFVHLVYEHGAFGADAGRATAAALGAYAWSVPALGLNPLLAYACFALNRAHVPVGAMVAGVIVQAAAGSLIGGGFGTMGIAVASCAGAWTAAAVQALALSRQLPNLRLWAGMGPPFAATLVMALAAGAGEHLLRAPMSAFRYVSLLGSLVGGLALLYGVMLWALRMPEALQAVAGAQGRLVRWLGA